LINPAEEKRVALRNSKACRGFELNVTGDDEDAALFIKVANGDKGAFAALFDRHQASVVRFAYRFVGNAARAEELAQDIFVKLYKGAKGYRPDAKFKTFMFRVATNHCLNELRRADYRSESKVSKTSEPSEVEQRNEAAALAAGEEGDRPDQALSGKELERAVSKALDGMSDRERAAFCMCRFEGLAYKEIASALEASEAAVKSLIHRATLQVMQQVEQWQRGLSPARSEA
jgi:RNA polymerase sigma-70 factor (ECF subfamily)